MSVSGKACVVTGAASGIGRATAELFVELGAVVVATDIDADGLATLEGVTPVVGDVAKDEDARAMIRAAVSLSGRIDVLVANAGVIPLLDVTEATGDDWDNVMAVDGKGMFLTCKYAIEAMRGKGRSIVCVSSISGVAGQLKQATYGPAKFVASGLTKHLAVEWAAESIRVNAVAPGAIRTAVVRALEAERESKAYIDGMAAMHPMNEAWGAGRGCAGDRVPGVRSGVVRHRSDSAGGRRIPGTVTISTHAMSLRVRSFGSAPVTVAHNR